MPRHIKLLNDHYETIIMTLWGKAATDFENRDVIGHVTVAIRAKINVNTTTVKCVGQNYELYSIVDGSR